MPVKFQFDRLYAFTKKRNLCIIIIVEFLCNEFGGCIHEEASGSQRSALHGLPELLTRTGYDGTVSCVCEGEITAESARAALARMTRARDKAVSNH